MVIWVLQSVTNRQNVYWRMNTYITLSSWISGMDLGGQPEKSPCHLHSISAQTFVLWDMRTMSIDWLCECFRAYHRDSSALTWLRCFRLWSGFRIWRHGFIDCHITAPTAQVLRPESTALRMCWLEGTCRALYKIKSSWMKLLLKDGSTCRNDTPPGGHSGRFFYRLRYSTRTTFTHANKSPRISHARFNNTDLTVLWR